MGAPGPPASARTPRRNVTADHGSRPARGTSGIRVAAPTARARQALVSPWARRASGHEHRISGAGHTPDPGLGSPPAGSLARTAGPAAAATAPGATAPRRPLARLAHTQRAAAEVTAVRSVEGVRHVRVFHLDEAEAPRTTGLTIAHDGRGSHLAERAEEILQLGLGGTPGEVSNVKLAQWIHPIAKRRRMGARRALAP